MPYTACFCRAAHAPALNITCNCRAALLQLAEDERWPTGWVFDGRRNMYSPLELDGKTTRQNTLSQEPQEFKVSYASAQEGLGTARAL